jgi:enoyl-CoA hydratase/carnithine racemase
VSDRGPFAPAEGLEARLADSVLWLRIRRPERANALTPSMLEAMAELLRRPPDGTAVGVLCSEGGTVFSAGADLSMMAPGGPGAGTRVPPGGAAAPAAHAARGAVREAMLALLECGFPVVARVQGLCLAGGVGLALACDLVVCAQSSQWAMPEIDRGLWPFMVSALLVRHVSPKLAMDWMMTGRRIPAAELARTGMISRLVADADLDAEVERVVAELRAKPPLALAAGKAAARAAAETTVPGALEAMQAQLSLLAASEDAAEGIAAFAERRSPVWRGR